MSHRFDMDTAVEPDGDDGYRAELSDAWNIGAVPNGGYQVAIMCRAVLCELGLADVLNVSTYFLGAASAGRASLRVEVLKRGRTTSVAEVRLLQGDRERARSLVLAGDLTTLEGPDLHRRSAPTMAPPDACLRFGPERGAPVVMNEVELRIDPRTTAFTRGETGAPPEMRSWVRFSDGREPDVLGTLFFADVMPPTTFNHLGVVGWVPTLELTIQLRRRPSPGWVRLDVVTNHISAGHFEEDGELWDAEDNLVAVSRQRAMLLRAP